MVTDLNYWSKVLKRIFNFALTLLLLFLLLKLSVFYLPFLIAFVLALLIEPIIKAIMKNFKWTRRTSSIFVIAISMLLLFLIAIIIVFSSLLNSGYRVTSRVTFVPL